MKKRRLFAYTHPYLKYFKPAALGCMLLLNIFPLKAQYAYSAPKKNVSVIQTPAEEKITLNIKNEKLATILEKIEKQAGLVFVYANDEVDVNQKASIAVNDKTVSEVVKQLLSPLGIGFIIVKDKIILQPANQKIPLTEGSNSNTIPDRSVAARDEKTISISGRVSDENGKGLGLILALPNYRLVPKGKTVLQYWETPPGQPRAMRAWFFPGDNVGQEFIYPKSEASQIAGYTGGTLPDCDIIL